MFSFINSFVPQYMERKEILFITAVHQQINNYDLEAISFHHYSFDLLLLKINIFSENERNKKKAFKRSEGLESYKNKEKFLN